jgi:hypothetical protein
MASFGTGFAAGLNSGMSMGKMLMDTYNDAKQKDDLEQAGKLDQTVTETGLTDEQQAQIAAIRQQKLDDGSNAFEVEDVNNGVRIRAAGNPDAEWGMVAGAKQYKLGNQTRDTEFSKDEIARARNEAIADAYTKNGDPGRGLQFKNAAREDRTAASIEAAREEYVTGLEDMASGKNMDKYIPMILRSYNDPRKGSKHDDGHNATYDPERNVVAFSDKDGRIVNTIPVNQQTLSAAWKERYLDKLEAHDPKLGLARQELGIKRDTLTETGRHNQATEGILRQRNGLLGGGGAKGQMGTPLGLSEDGKGVIYNTPQGIVVKPLPAGVDGAKLFPKVTGLKGEEAQVEYDDGNGMKIKGTPGQVHNSRMKVDGSYRAANGGDGLAMAPPASNQTGKTGAPIKPMSIEYNQSAYDNYLSYAKRGDPQAKAILAGWVQSNELSAGQRKEAERYIR